MEESKWNLEITGDRVMEGDTIYEARLTDPRLQPRWSVWDAPAPVVRRDGVLGFMLRESFVPGHEANRFTPTLAFRVYRPGDPKLGEICP